MVISLDTTNPPDFPGQEEIPNNPPENRPRRKISIYDLLGLLIVLTGILAILGILFYDPLRDIIAHRPISKTDIGLMGQIGLWCAVLQLFVGISIIIVHLLLKNHSIQSPPQISWK